MVLLQFLNQKYNKYLHSVKIQKAYRGTVFLKDVSLKRFQKIGDKHCLLQNTLQSLNCAVQLRFDYNCAILFLHKLTHSHIKRSSSAAFCVLKISFRKKHNKC